MKVLFWFFDELKWNPSMKTLDKADDALPGSVEKTVAAFVHVEPADLETPNASKVETKLVKNCKWLAGKWKVKRVVLHSFAHLGSEKAEPDASRVILSNARQRLEKSGYEVFETPYGYFLDISFNAPGHPLARIFKEF